MAYLVCKTILVFSLSLSQAEQFKAGRCNGASGNFGKIPVFINPILYLSPLKSDRIGFVLKIMEAMQEVV